MKEKSTRAEYHKNWYTTNRERVLAVQKKYYEANKDKVRKYNEENKESIALRKKAYAERNKEKNREYYKDYYENPENKHRKNLIAKANIDKTRARVRLAYQTKPQFFLKCRLRCRLARAFRLKRQSKKFSHIDFLGCSPDFLVKYIESQFTDGMSWDRRSEIHIDHIIPLHMFDLTDEKQCRRACHYTNLRPLWAKDNLTRTYDAMAFATLGDDIINQ